MHNKYVLMNIYNGLVRKGRKAIKKLKKKYRQLKNKYKQWREVPMCSYCRIYSSIRESTLCRYCFSQASDLNIDGGKFYYFRD